MDLHSPVSIILSHCDCNGCARAHHWKARSQLERQNNVTLGLDLVAEGESQLAARLKLELTFKVAVLVELPVFCVFKLHLKPIDLAYRDSLNNLKLPGCIAKVGKTQGYFASDCLAARKLGGLSLFTDSPFAAHTVFGAKTGLELLTTGDKLRSTATDNCAAPSQT